MTLKLKTFNAYLLLTILCLLLYLPGIFTIPVIDRDEAHFVQATKQMLETGNYFQIRFQDITRFQKPPGINWLQALSVKAFSHTESIEIWPYRIPSVLGALFAVLLTFTFGRRMSNDKVALLAAALLACTLLLTIEAHMALTDAMLLTAMVLMQGALGLIYLKSQDKNNDSAQKRWALPTLFWLAMSFGFLLKGVTPLVGILTIVALCLFDRNISWVKHVRPIWGIFLFVITSSWLYFVNEAEQTNYLNQMIAKDLWPKLISGHESHGAPPGYHLVLSVVTLWPASLFLWQAAVWGWKHRNQVVEKFLIAWIVPTWIFYELMPTKLPQYVLPLFPAICLLAAFAIIESRQMLIRGKHLVFLKVLYLLWGLVSFILAGAIFALPYLANKVISLPALFVLLIMCSGTILAIIFAYQTQFKKSAITLIICVIFSYGTFFQIILPSMKPIWLSDRIKAAIENSDQAILTASEPLYVNNYREPSLVFLLGTDQVKYAPLSDLIFHLQQKPLGASSTYALLNEQQVAELKEEFKSDDFNISILTKIDGYNYNGGKYIELLLINAQHG
jgi:4-amino-4-deoxy-L-arabinose transferase-like glycosyltransferase